MCTRQCYGCMRQIKAATAGLWWNTDTAEEVTVAAFIAEVRTERSNEYIFVFSGDSLNEAKLLFNYL